MAATTPAPKNTVHWAPSPILSPHTDTSSVTTASSISSTSTLQYINSQLISHGFAVTPGLCLDGLSSADAEALTKCLLSMLSQRVEDMTRAEELTTKLRTLSYDYERLRTMYDSSKETADLAEREAAAARAKLTTANRAQQQAETANKQTMADLQRARSSLQALRATHVAELKKRDKEIEAMRERWSKLADSQLKIGNLPSGMSIQPANALALGEDAKVALLGKGLKEAALEEAEKACALLRDENGELRGLLVDTANAVRKILHKAVSADPDDLEFLPPLVTTDLFPLGAPDTAFERFSALLTALRDALTTLRASEAPATTTPGSDLKQHISLADLAKKAAESDAKAHKWEVEELRTTIAVLRDELKKANAATAPASQVQLESVPTVYDNLASHLPPTDGLEIQHELVVGHSEAEQAATDPSDEPSSRKAELLSTASVPARGKRPAPAPQPGPSRLSPRKTRSKSKAKLAHTSKPARSSASAKRSAPGPRMKRQTSKRVEASFETEVIPASVPTSLLPTSFVLPPPLPESRLPPHPASFLAPSAPLLFPSTTPPLPPPPPQISSSSTAEGTQEMVSGAPMPKPFPIAKPLARAHAYSPAKPSPLSRILMLAASPDNAAAPRHQATAAATALLPAALNPHSSSNPNPNPHPAFTATAVFEPPLLAPAPEALPTSVPVPAVFEPPTVNAPAPLPLPLRAGAASNAPARRRVSKRTSGDAELDIDNDIDTDTHPPNPNPNPNSQGGGGIMDVDDVGGARDPRAPEKENTIRRRLKGPAAAAKTRKTTVAASSSSSKSAATHNKAAVPAPAPASKAESTLELGRVGGAASRLLAAARGSGVGGESTVGGPRRVPIGSVEAAAGVPARPGRE
ncbi:Afadin and alpha-actinin-binding-domain-containing protein [Lactifluus subvellereus]|nr:Afadin and alpha-actinin-binding-domain-containing protein [Lactifluus subvellereus]